ncbi:breast carcinoma-amplified sequence 4-like [Diceros bicornis minor]|uniref:breast carcinoma-amplified sequence 4-like n=1 Tax=Diceros bicornis minor TaxID=77932 RepID=UPI0026EFF6CD|nr:breast carcinoma-amplified sequence 4-like [Diceros bicornis minor]
MPGPVCNRPGRGLEAQEAWPRTGAGAAACANSVLPDPLNPGPCEGGGGEPRARAPQRGRVCSPPDMIRSNTFHILEENTPLPKAKVMEMRGIYAQVDQLEALVQMVGHHVPFLAAHMLLAEWDHGAFLQGLRRWLGPTGLCSFRNKLSLPPPR